MININLLENVPDLKLGSSNIWGGDETPLIKLIHNLRSGSGSEDSILNDAKQATLQAMKDPSSAVIDNTKVAWYLNMFGYTSEALNQLVLVCMSSSDLATKKIGYSACLDILEPDTSFTMMTTNMIRKDLESTELFANSMALSVVAQIMPTSMATELFGVIKKHISSTRPYLRKKTCIALLRVILIDSEYAKDALKLILEKLDDTDAGVLTAVFMCLQHVANKPEMMDEIFETLPRISHVLSTSDSNWVKIRLLKLLCKIIEYNHKASSVLKSFLLDIPSEGALSFRYECYLSGIKCLEPGSDAYNTCKEKAYTIFSESDKNLRLIGLKMLDIGARREREHGTNSVIPKEHFDDLIALADCNDAATNEFALSVIANYASGQQAQAICDKLVDTAVNRKMPFIIPDVIDILARENMFANPETHFLLGDMWRNSAILSCNPHAVTKMQEFTETLTMYKGIIDIAIVTLDEEKSPPDMIHPALYLTIMSILDTRYDDLAITLKNGRVPKNARTSYSIDDFVGIISRLRERNKEDSVLYIKIGSLMHKLGVHGTCDIRAELQVVDALQKRHTLLNERIEKANINELTTIVKKAYKAVGVKIPMFEDTGGLRAQSEQEMDANAVNLAPWPVLVKKEAEEVVKSPPTHTKTRDMFKP